MNAPSDPVALVTGASGALGRASVAAFAADGYRLGLVGTNAERLASVAKHAGLADDRWIGPTADVRDADAVGAAVKAVEGRFGRIDVALHLVGGFVAGAPITELDPANLAFMLDQHLWSTLHVARAVIPGMVERGWGRILAVTSSTTASTPARSAVYATSKAAQETLLKVLAKEVGGSGVTVNIVAVRQIDADHAREREPSPKNAAWTTPEEIVAAFRYLASDAAGAVNGARIPLDGRS
ncbi:MAG TPA: SDR family NAD(P)-dependent oxidoreductase [Candidatus Limnocylindrales bacterium]|jgi:NAD(P)-dependent dehydrogenase (short-subunit alcohol dehydrogenase family)|nr:SDR family NAD(P)-dependent oxidoreductase [Candidatus Limnocylindrales bacterium]